MTSLLLNSSGFVMMQVPLWVWITWIPQLLVSLQRPESLHCKRILTLLALSYPQVRWSRPYNRETQCSGL
jgi:transformation/transcription domain-associated protein